MVASDTETVPDAAKKHPVQGAGVHGSASCPEDGHRELPFRTITFHRDDMLPYDQEIYDNQGAPETLIVYSNYTRSAPESIPRK